MSKFTPGPWLSKQHNGAGRVMEFKREFWEVGGGPDNSGVAFVFKGQANADLVSAAPELYAMLRAVQIANKFQGFLDPRFANDIDAALAKADGGQ